MTSTIRIATTQMNANPTPLADRLARAERLVVAAAETGAQLAALPELFNLGYTYSDENLHRAEPPDGPTVAWMRETAARLGVHLAGTLLLLDHDDVYNALLLIAPDGRTWRYDKAYPWGWERATFRPGHRITVAESDLGRIGMMICWDVAHPTLWRRYAGRVDVMLVCSCPPNVGEATYHLPGDVDMTLDDLGPAMRLTQGSARRVFGEVFSQQAAWLGVPAVGSGGLGQIRTVVPNGLGSMVSIVSTAPWLIRYLPRASRLALSCEIAPACKVVDADGQVVSALGPEDGEALTLAEVTLPPPDARPAPKGPQPSPGISRFVYFVSDALLPTLTAPVYRRGLRRARGATWHRWTSRTEGLKPVTAAHRGVRLGRRGAGRGRGPGGAAPETRVRGGTRPLATQGDERARGRVRHLRALKADRTTSACRARSWPAPTEGRGCLGKGPSRGRAGRPLTPPPPSTPAPSSPAR